VPPAQARITRLKAVSAVTSHVLPRSWRRKRLDRCTPSVRNTMRGSGDHHRIGSPSLNHGKMPPA
jgi:hypothetical protein